MLVPLALVHDKKLQQQVYEQIRALIDSGRLPTGTRMPSTRMLADGFSISRMTVMLAYERLIAEGYLQTAPAKGTFVNSATPVREPSDIRSAAADSACVRRVGAPDPALFPVNRWRTLVRSGLDQALGRAGCLPPAGNPALRSAVAQWLAASRGLAVSPEQVLLVSGRRQALHIAMHLLLDGAGCAVMAEAAEPDAMHLLRSTGTSLLTIPTDAEGIRVDELPELPVRLLHVMPENDCPSGGMLSLARRQALLDWAARTGATVLSEDCDGELRYEPSQAPPLMAMDTAGQVVHVGCFAATLGPVLTLGYLVVPERLIGPALLVRNQIDEHARWADEAALAAFLESGDYARHVHRLRKAYLARRNRLSGLMRDYFGENGRLGGGQTGLRLSWPVAPGLGDSEQVAATARACGLDAAAFGPGLVLLGFGQPTEALMFTAVARLAALLTDAAPRPVAEALCAD